MKKKDIVLIFLLALYNIPIFGQYRPVENYPSPNVASLGEYGNIPVSLYTGQPNVSIPLYEVKEGDIILPVTMDYNLANVKPNRRSGWVGLGWNLSAGGYITRNVRGVYDEQQNSDKTSYGFYENYTYLQSIKDSASLGMYKDNFLGEKNGISVFELMTDEYHFNFCNYSGNFYLDEYGEWVVVSDDDIRIEFNPTSGFRSVNNLRSEIRTNNWGAKHLNNRFFDIFTLITPDGVRYTFGGENATEYSISYYNRNSSYLVPTTWFLTEIKSPKGYFISLEYDPGLPVCEIQFAAFSSYTYIDGDDPTSLLSWETVRTGGDSWLRSGDSNYGIKNTTGRKKLSGYLIFPVYLKTITASYVTVNLHSGTQMLTEKETLPYADFMAWSDDTEFNSPFSNQPYYPSNQFAAFMPSNNICKIQTEYLGWHILRAISVVPSDTSFTKTYYLEYGWNKWKKLTCIAERKGGYNPVESWIRGGWYDCNGNESLGLLLSYSTPGASGYTPKDYHFRYNTDEGFPRYIFASTDHWGYYNGYTEAEEKGERGYSTTYLFDENFYQSRQPTYSLDIAKAETLKEIIYPTRGKTCFEYKQNRYSKIVPENLDEELEQKTGNAGGLCISEIHSYDENNNLIQTKRYYYADIIPSDPDYYTTSGILKAEKKYALTYSFSNGFFSLCSEGGFLTAGTNRMDSHITYSTVIEETIDSSGNSNGFVRYKYTNYGTDIWGENHADKKYLYAYNISGDSYYNPSSSKSMERGKILSKEYFNSDRKLIKSIQYKYIRTEETPMKTIHQEKIIIPYGKGTNDYYYAYIAYMAPTYIHRYLLSNEIETDYDFITGQTMQIKEKAYTYNSNKIINSENLINSNGDALRISYKYPSDFETDPYTSMVDENILTPVVEKTTYKGNNWLQKEITDYEYRSGRLFVPQYFKTQKQGQSSPEIRIRYSDYEWYGKPLKVDKDGVIIYYIWAFNGQYLNAEIKNMDENSYFFVPGEDQFDEEYYGYMREEFPNAHISSYTHIPSIGITTSTTHGGVTTTYNYDALGRLINIKDENDKTMENYEYHYK